MGFQHMPEVVRRAAQSKGGKIKTDKGLAKVSPDKLKEITSLGGKAKHASNQSRNGAKQTQADNGRSLSELADVLGDIDEQVSQ